jgi:hypothetical protein
MQKKTNFKNLVELFEINHLKLIICDHIDGGRQGKRGRIIISVEKPLKLPCRGIGGHTFSK